MIKISDYFFVCLLVYILPIVYSSFLNKKSGPKKAA